MIFDVSPTDTPVLSAIKKVKATGRTHEWQTDALTAATAANAAIEGNDQSATAPSATTRLNNVCQILTKDVIVTGTQEAVDKAGRKSEVAYQKARRMKEIKRDLEKSMIGANALGKIKATGNDTTARAMASYETYILSNFSGGTSGAVSTGDGTDLLTAGTDRNFTEAILAPVLATAYTNGGDPTMLCVSPTNKAAVGDFTAGGATRYVTTDEAKLAASVDVYVGDFHTLKVVPCRQIIGDNVLCLDPEYMAFAELRAIHAKKIGDTGDSYREQIIWEGTLEVCNEAAHALVADTNG